MQLLLEAEGVTKSFNGVPALRNGRLALRAGSVHALCGGNGAGKSTFLNIIMGLLARDGGTVKVRGEDVLFADPLDARRARIAIITQELSPVPEMTVAENIFLGRELMKFSGFVDFPAMERAADKILKDIGFDINPRAKMADLSLAQVQLVEITRALSADAEIIIMDEPTSAIGENETQILFDAIRRLTAKGAGIIYVSHRLEELSQIADTYSVFRDGGFVEEGEMAGISRDELVRLIVGHEVTSIEHKPRDTAEAPALEAKNICAGQKVKGISLTLYPGEVLGLYGLIGAGRSEFLSAVYGNERRDSGEVKLFGQELAANAPERAIAGGMVMVTEDRKATGLVLQTSIRNNISLSILASMSCFGFIKKRQEQKTASELFNRLQVKAANDLMPVGALSGGNQQKVIFARCFSSAPKIILCDEPTRGIDEGAKQEIYSLINQFVNSGGAVIMASSEAPELLQNCDRIAVFKDGRLVRVLHRSEASQHSLLAAAT